MHKYKSISFENPVSTQPSMHKQSDQKIKDFVIRLIAHRKIHPCLLVDNTLIMTEGIETDLAMVSPHAALPKTAEAHLTCRQVFCVRAHTQRFSTAMPWNTAGQVWSIRSRLKQLRKAGISRTIPSSIIWVLMVSAFSSSIMWNRSLSRRNYRQRNTHAKISIILPAITRKSNNTGILYVPVL